MVVFLKPFVSSDPFPFDGGKKPIFHHVAYRNFIATTDLGRIIYRKISVWPSELYRTSISVFVVPRSIDVRSGVVSITRAIGNFFGFVRTGETTGPPRVWSRTLFFIYFLLTPNAALFRTVFLREKPAAQKSFRCKCRRRYNFIAFVRLTRQRNVYTTRSWF